MRTPLCVAFARRTLAGVMVAAVPAGAVWATSSSAEAVLAPVETAQIKLVPSRVVRVDGSVLSATFQPPPVPTPVPDATLPGATPLLAPGERERVLEQFARAAQPSAGSKAAKPSTGTAVRSAAAPSGARKSNTHADAAQATKGTQLGAAAPLLHATAPTAKVATRDPGALSADAAVALAQVLHTRDNAGAPFIIIDKRQAHLWLFDAQGQARGHTAVLLGLARGDDTVPGIGDKPLAQIKRGERTTPAGRFVAEAGRNARGDDIYWIDYDAAVSMHRVHDVDPGDNRLQRLATPTPADNRISYGCINVPVAFYDGTLLPAIARTRPVVYLLPETRSVATLFEPTRMAGRSSRLAPKGS